MAKRTQSVFLDEVEVSGTDSSDDENSQDTAGSLREFIASEDDSNESAVTSLLAIRAREKRARVVDSDSETETDNCEASVDQEREFVVLPELSTPTLVRAPRLEDVAPPTPIASPNSIVQIPQTPPSVRQNRGSGRQRKGRRFALTLNNFNDLDKTLFKSFPNTRYKCFGVEGLSEGRTPHLQCYIELPRSSQLTVTGLRKRITEHWSKNCQFHIEIANASGFENKEYCSKEANEFWEDGEPPIGNGVTRGQGKRSDLDEVSDLVKKGTSFKEIAMLQPKSIIKFHKGIRVLMKTICYNVRSSVTVGYWCWGPTGSGKSRWAYSLSPDSTYVKDPMSKFFCNYAQEETVIVDDFRPHKEFPFSFLLRLADRYPLTVQVKGEDSVQFNSKRIVVTSPHNIDDTFRHLEFLKEGDVAQLKRRFRELEFKTGSIVPSTALLETEEVFPQPEPTINEETPQLIRFQQP